MEAGGGGGGGPSSALADISNSLAYNILDDLESRGVLSSAQVHMYKSRYAQLHEVVLETYENEKVLLAKAKQMNLDWIDRKKKLEKKANERQDYTERLQDLRTQLEQRSQEVGVLEEQAGLALFEIEEMQRQRADLDDELEMRRKESEQLTLPHLEKLQAQIKEARDDLASQDEANAKEVALREEYTARLAALKDESEALEKQKHVAQIELNRAKVNPDRIRAQIDMSAKANSGLAKQSAYLSGEIDKLNGEFDAIGMEKKKIGAAQIEWMFNLEKIRKEVWKSERTVGEVSKHLEAERQRYNDRLQCRLELEAEANRMRSSIRAETSHIQSLTKAIDELKRRYEKTRRKADAIASGIEPLREQHVAQGHQLAAVDEETRKNRETVDELQADIDILISQFLREEKTDLMAEAKLKEYRDINANLEEGLRHSMRKERELRGLIRDMTSKRDVMSRDTTKAGAEYRAVREEIKVKDLILLDLGKKVQDVKARLHECSVVYDLVKNQRNKFGNMTQACAQGLAEMREKIKILQNEMEILRAESIAKEKSLEDEARVLQTAQTTRDAMRIDHAKLRLKYRLERLEADRQLTEIKKLNATIGGAEREMTRVRQAYARAVESRNRTGIHLVDRNDELCILHEKATIFASMLQSGQRKLAELDDTLRRTRIETDELQRQISAARKQAPSAAEVAKLEARLADLTGAVNEQRERIADLSDKLETPALCQRHRLLPGDDLDVPQLNSKIEVLQDRLNDKKEQLLEKDLVLEEVGTLSDKLRAEAAEGHDRTMGLAADLNKRQGTIRELTQAMKATVAELAMYQASAMRLEKEVHDKQKELGVAQDRVAEGLAPSEAAEHEWYRIERERLRRRDDYLHPERRQTDEFQWQRQEGNLKTMAEARPNAYVPDDLGIPKPYGGNAPFKPSVPGASMRHIQKPRVKEIVI
ncbi:Cilia- and flagella-associated protein 58 central coiled coil domain-containing protein [Plasmodiophora brassicae]